jgi:ubiquinone/menaquinone biosynthesis C-methylase UbiE
MLRHLIRPLLRLAFHLFYNPFAFTYDFVSAVVSRGRWRAWTRAAIPRLAGARVLELACGTGNLLLDLNAAGYAPVGVDLSPSMLCITRDKLQQARANVPLVRARAQALPFSDRAFDASVLTFPPEFVSDPRALAEIHRLLTDDGRLVWVDAGRLLPRDLPSRLLNRAWDAVGGDDYFARSAIALLARAGFEARIETVQDDASIVLIALARKKGFDNAMPLC